MRWVERACVVCGFALALAACTTAPIAKAPPQGGDPLGVARDAASSAERETDPRRATGYWLRCATYAWTAMQADPRGPANLATHCTDRFVTRALAQRPDPWTEGDVHIDGVAVRVVFRDLSPALQPPLGLTQAREVSMAPYGGERHAQAGFGVPLAAISPRCEDAPQCALWPPEGVFRGATAWIERGGDDTPMLVLADPLRRPALEIAGERIPLSIDTSAAWARGVQTSKLQRLGVWGLIGGDEVGRRAGVYLLDDYDPNKRPLVMIHGLGSSPLIWARLSNAVWGDPALRARFQIWHVVYQTNAPLLVARRRVQRYLDDAWRALDPEHDDPARGGMVLVGHSLGGVIARLLCVDSGDRLWNAAFTVPPEALTGDEADRATLGEVFRFNAYPGVTRAIFLAAPHRGSPRSMTWFGRFMRVVVGKRAPELQGLKRIALANPEAIRPELREAYEKAALNSITTLQIVQPVRIAGESLVPRDIPYHSIAGALPHSEPQSDGVVPLDSTTLEGAQSTLVLPSGHKLYENPEAIAEVVRILHVALSDAPQSPAP
jgi:pimeloyl-ACP methyl ester carboxylesterase